MRRTLLALLTALLVLATPALAGAQAPAATPVQDDELLAPPGRCAHDANAGAHHRLQRLAMQCLLRQLRRRADLPRLRESVALRHSATYKARRIAACKVFTHTPCGDELSVPFAQARVNRRGDWFVGEDLAWGVADDATPRAILAKWLASPTHRAVLLDESFTHFGLRRRRLRMRGAPVGAIIWVAHLGRRASG